MPESLRERILGVVTSAASAGSGGRSADVLHERLRRLGDGLLAQAKSAPASQDTALMLLAADALMTFACEAMAHAAPERLGELW